MSKSLNVLLVEASDRDAERIECQIRQADYDLTLRRVEDEPGMRAALSERPWDVVLSAYSLPRFSGVAALSALRERTVDIPFVIVSGSIGEDSAVEAMKAGVQDCVLKSDLSRLVPVVERELLEAAARRQRRRAELIRTATYQISESANRARDLGELFVSIHQVVGQLMPAQNFFIALYEPEHELIRFPYFVDECEPPPGQQKVSRGLTGYVLTTGKPLLAPLALCKQMEADGEIEIEGPPCVYWLGVPLKTNDATLGVLGVQTYQEGVYYTEEDKDILMFVSNQIALVISRKQSEADLRASEIRYRSLFEHSPVSLWEEDFSAVKHSIDELHNQGVTDFRLYFDAHPELVSQWMSSIRVLDVNLSTVRLYGAAAKEDLVGHLDYILCEESLKIFKEELIAIAEGKLEFEASGVNRKLNGEPIDIILRWNINPEYAATLERIIVSVLDITGRQTAERQLQNQIHRLDGLRTIDMAITASMDLRVTLDVLLDQVVNQLHVDAADILILSPHSKMLDFAAGRGFRGGLINRARQHMGEGYAGRVVLDRRPIILPDLSRLPEHQRPQVTHNEEFAAYFGFPLLAKGQVKGVLEVFHRTPMDETADWLEFLETLAGQAAIAIDNATLFENLQRSNVELALAYDATIEGWSRALDLRDKETEGHTRRVTQMTLRLAEQLGLGDEEMVHIRRGALLHDIGKMGIADTILFSPGALDEESWESMRKHPLYAYELLSPISYLQPSLDIPYCHHERWDGTGYPRGLKGEQIPLAARLFSVVDVYDSLRSNRPYRGPWPENEVRAYLKQQSGAFFDPKVVELFMQLLDHNNLT